MQLEYLGFLKIKTICCWILPLQMTLSNDSVKLTIVDYCFTYVCGIVRWTLGLKIPFKLYYNEEGKSLKEGKRLIKDETKSLCA